MTLCVRACVRACVRVSVSASASESAAAAATAAAFLCLSMYVCVCSCWWLRVAVSGRQRASMVVMVV